MTPSPSPFAKSDLLAFVAWVVAPFIPGAVALALRVFLRDAPAAAILAVLCYLLSMALVVLSIWGAARIRRSLGTMSGKAWRSIAIAMVLVFGLAFYQMESRTLMSSLDGGKGPLTDAARLYLVIWILLLGAQGKLFWDKAADQWPAFATEIVGWRKKPEQEPET